MRPGALLMLALLGAAPATAQQHAEHAHARPAQATSTQRPAAPPIAAFRTWIFRQIKNIPLLD